MIDQNATHLRGDFLTRLDAAMQNVPHGVATEIHAGIAEELDGLDAAATAERIAQLGDPVDIAREAQTEIPVALSPASSEAPKPRATATRWFAITAGLALGFGGIIVPFVGWVVGAVLVCMSSLWRTWEKVVAITVPFAVTGVSLLVTSLFSPAVSGGSSNSTGSEETVNNPLVPTLYDLAWSHVVILLGLLLVPASGLWLLWRLRGRTDRSAR